MQPPRLSRPDISQVLTLAVAVVLLFLAGAEIAFPPHGAEAYAEKLSDLAPEDELRPRIAAMLTRASTLRACCLAICSLTLGVAFCLGRNHPSAEPVTDTNRAE